MSFNLRDCRYKTTLINHNFLYILITRYTYYGLKLMTLRINRNQDFAILRRIAFLRA